MDKIKILTVLTMQHCFLKSSWICILSVCILFEPNSDFSLSNIFSLCFLIQTNENEEICFLIISIFFLPCGISIKFIMLSAIYLTLYSVYFLQTAVGFWKLFVQWWVYPNDIFVSENFEFKESIKVNWCCVTQWLINCNWVIIVFITLFEHKN